MVKKTEGASDGKIYDNEQELEHRTADTEKF